MFRSTCRVDHVVPDEFMTSSVATRVHDIIETRQTMCLMVSPTATSYRLTHASRTQRCNTVEKDTSPSEEGKFAHCSQSISGRGVSKSFKMSLIEG